MAVQTQIQTRRGTAATWTSTNPTLAAGEIGFETDTNKFKIGTGSTAWTALAYAANTSPLTTKGDLYTYSTTNDRLAVGNNGETLVADSSTSTGLRYQGSITAGKNFIINGGMDIWQRGTSFTNPGSTYTVDRWNGYWSANGTVTQETTNVPSGCRYALKMTATANSAGNNFYQMIETNNTIPLAGKVVTFSAYVAGTAGKTPIIGIDTSTVVDDSLFGSWTALAVSSSVTTSTTYQRISVTATIPSTAKSIRVHMDSYPVNNTDYLLWGGLQLELGSVATAFSRAGGTIQGELAACQRYYYLHASGTSKMFANANALSATFAQGYIQFPVTMRSTPTTACTSGTDYYDFNRNGGDDLFNSLTVYLASTTGTTLYNSTEIASTAGHGGLFLTNNASAFVAFTAEL